MTNQQHPITPPPELVEQWRDLPEFTDGRRKMIMVTLSREKLLDIATQAARWGADQELEACCEWLRDNGLYETRIGHLRAARRPKLLSLKKQALKILEEEPESDDMKELIVFDTAQVEIIRRALEQLND